MLLATLCLSGCEYDNFDEPTSNLVGRVVYESEPVGVRTHGTKLQLWEDGHELRIPMDVHIAHDGTFSAVVFDGTYKLIRQGDAPWLPQPTDTMEVTVRGQAQVDFPVTPYFTIRNASVQKVGDNIEAQFTVDKIVESANLNAVNLYLGRAILTDEGRHELKQEANVSSIQLGQETTLSAKIPDGLKDLEYIFVRIGVRSQSSNEFYYTQVQRLEL